MIHYLNNSGKGRKTPLKRKFIKYFCISILIPLIATSFLNYELLSINTRKNATRIFNDIVVQTSENINLILKNIENVANGVAFNVNTQNMIYNSEYNSDLANFDQNSVQKMPNDFSLSDFTLFLDIVGNLIVFSEDGKVVTSMVGYNLDVNIRNYEWYDRVKASQGENIWISSHFDRNDFNSENKHVISLVKKIRRIDNSTGDMGKGIGYLLINIKEKDIYSILSKVKYGDTGSLFIIDSSSGIISNSNKDMIGKKFEDIKLDHNVEGEFTSIGGKKVLLTHCTLKKTDWNLIGIIDSAEVMHDSSVTLMISIIISGILLFIFIFISVILSNSISMPIRRLQNHMRKVEKGNFNIEIEREYNILEIDDLFKGFNLMVNRLDKLINEVYEAELKEKEMESAVKQAELNALQQQINPHFLYNTLDSINWLASLDGNENIASMVTALGEFFRSSINKGVNFITIEDELKNVNYYIYIQQIRYSSKLEFKMEIMDEVKKYMTMKLLLQPIVENSIIHGIEPKRGKGNVTINISKIGDCIRFSIIDDGVGFSENKVSNIFNNEDSQKGQSIGLKNVAERLKLYFGERHKFEIRSTINIGTEVLVTIPCFFNESELIKPGKKNLI